MNSTVGFAHRNVKMEGEPPVLLMEPPGCTANFRRDKSRVGRASQMAWLVAFFLLGLIAQPLVAQQLTQGVLLQGTATFIQGDASICNQAGAQFQASNLQILTTLSDSPPLTWSQVIDNALDGSGPGYGPFTATMTFSCSDGSLNSGPVPATGIWQIFAANIGQLCSNNPDSCAFLLTIESTTPPVFCSLFVDCENLDNGWNTVSWEISVNSTGLTGAASGFDAQGTICLAVSGVNGGCPGSTPPATTPTINRVSSIAPQQDQTITLTGSGLGTQTPYNSDSMYLEIADLTGNWTAGYINNGSPNQVTLNVTSWTDSQIVIQGFTGNYGQNNWVLNPGDKIQVSVWNPQSNAGPATQTVTVGASTGSSTPVLTSVSPIVAQPNQTITLSGSGFGTQTPYNGDSQYLEIADLTGNWIAGWINNGSPNQVTLNVTSWTDSQIVIQGFTGDYGQNNWVLNPGDKIQVSVWNPQSNAGPATQTVTVGASTGSSMPVLTSVSPIVAQPNQTITLSGSGFGTQTPYNGDSQYLEIADLTGNWIAGWINNGSPNQVTLNVTSWTDSQIVIQGFTGDYGQNNWVLNPGDKIQVSVWNPQSNAGPATQTVTVGASTGSSMPVLTSVSPIVAQPNQTITLSGSGFGTQTPYNGDSQYLEIADLTGNWIAGWINNGSPNQVTLNVTSWTDSQIVIQGFTGDYGQNNWVLNPGDKIQVSVWNPQSNAGPATQTVTVGASTGSSMPVLTSVSPIVAQPNQTITLSGSGFGTQTPYNGDSQYLEIADLTGNWIAGWINNGSPNQVTLNVTSWTDSQIVIQGFTGDYGQNNWVLNPGDKIQVSVWNPQSNAGPATKTVTVGASTGSSMPVLTSVSPIVAQPNQTITLSGSGFGTQTPYNGDSQYLEIADLTGNWIAGWINNGSPNQVTLNVTSWTDSQ